MLALSSTGGGKHVTKSWGLGVELGLCPDRNRVGALIEISPGSRCKAFFLWPFGVRALTTDCYCCTVWGDELHGQVCTQCGSESL